MNVKLKICGMKDPENIRSLAALSPDYFGFIFHPSSKRFVGEDFNTGILADLPEGIARVGVFVDAPAGAVESKIQAYGLTHVQLHGEESPEYCGALSAKVKVIKAFGIHPEFDFGTTRYYSGSCDAFLFDTATATHGGSGRTFDWNLLGNYQGETPYFLSGGIGMENIHDLITWYECSSKSPGTRIHKALSRLHGLDVNSRFEIAPGLKNLETIKQLKHILS